MLHCQVHFQRYCTLIPAPRRPSARYFTNLPQVNPGASPLFAPAWLPIACHRPAALAAALSSTTNSAKTTNTSRLFRPLLPSQLFPTTSPILSITPLHHDNPALPDSSRLRIPTLSSSVAEYFQHVPLSARPRTFTTPGCFPPCPSHGHKINQNVDASLSCDDPQSAMMEQPNNSAEPPLWPHDRPSAGPLAQSASMPLRTASSTPVSSPGLFSPTPSRHILHASSVSESNTPAPPPGGPFLHPLQTRKVRE